MRPTLDDRDRALIAALAALFDQCPGPRIGDFMDFGQVSPRVSHVWRLNTGDEVQTSDGGSFYLGEGYCSFSGGLYIAVKVNALTPTAETREGDAWLFHHNQPMADNGVYFHIPFRVYRCALDAPRFWQGKETA